MNSRSLVIRVLLLCSSYSLPALAQVSDPNPGAITLTTGVDFPTVYFFRGIRQETDPELTTFAFGDVGIALFSGDGILKNAGVDFGVWNRLHTGTSGSGATPTKSNHYEEDFYIRHRTGDQRQGRARQQVRALRSGRVRAQGQADTGLDEGTYAELGIGPSWPLADGTATMAVPVKVGLSLKDYYESAGTDNSFGYIDSAPAWRRQLPGLWRYDEGIQQRRQQSGDRVGRHRHDVLMDAIPLLRRATSLEAMLRSIVSIMEPYSNDIGVKLKTVLEPGLPPIVTLDEDKIAWAIGTPIRNALRHVPRGSFFHPGGEIVLRAASKPETGEITIDVTDDGPGIPLEKVALLFQFAPYQRRVGYALILAREIALAHGGDMVVESTQDPHTHGTTVRLVLPAH